MLFSLSYTHALLIVKRNAHSERNSNTRQASTSVPADVRGVGVGVSETSGRRQQEHSGGAEAVRGLQLCLLIAPVRARNAQACRGGRREDMGQALLTGGCAIPHKGSAGREANDHGPSGTWVQCE